MKTVFLDRDGTINEEVDNLTDISQLKIFPDVAEGIKKLKQRGFLIIVISNQPVVARGWITETDLHLIHKELLDRLKKQGAIIDAVYYCPHHPNATLPEYRKICDCRKPHTGMITRAVHDFDIDLKRSFFVGDMMKDIQTAKNAEVRSILVKTGYGGGDAEYDVEPDYIARKFQNAVHYILKNSD